MTEVHLDDHRDHKSPDEIIASQIIAEFRQHSLIDAIKEAEILAQLVKGQLEQEDWQRLAEIADEV